jgi:hypothetical protein
MFLRDAIAICPSPNCGEDTTATGKKGKMVRGIGLAYVSFRGTSCDFTSLAASLVKFPLCV